MVYLTILAIFGGESGGKGGNKSNAILMSNIHQVRSDAPAVGQESLVSVLSTPRKVGRGQQQDYNKKGIILFKSGL